MRRALALLVLACVAVGCAGGSPLGRWLGAKPAWEQPLPPPFDAPVVPEGRLHREELPNGVRVLVLEDRRLPAFSLDVVVPRGTALENAAEAGIASFAAELMERGAGSRGALELAAVVDALRAALEVGSEWDAMHALVAGLSGDADALFDVLADVVLRPRFDVAEAERVRAESLAALRQAADDAPIIRWYSSTVIGR